MSRIFDRFLVQKPDLLLDQLDVGPDFYQRLDERYDSFRSHTLISAHEFSEDWPTWEIHPHGDEFVVLLSGSARFLLRTNAGDQEIELTRPGEFVVVPKGTWHTAKIRDAASMLFVTPGEGTLNEASPPK